MTDYTKPVYEVDGKEYRTVGGLVKRLTQKHNADSTSMIGSDRLLKVYRTDPSKPQGHRTECVAVYKVTAPEIGKPMILTLVAFTA